MDYLDQLLLISGTVFGLILLFAIGFFVWHHWCESKDRQREKYITTLFYEMWTGDEADRPYAWFRVIQHLKNWNPDPRMIRMAEHRRARAKQIASSATMVDPEGQLVEPPSLDYGRKTVDRGDN